MALAAARGLPMLLGLHIGDDAKAETARTSPASNGHPTETTKPTFRWTCRFSGGRCCGITAHGTALLSTSRFGEFQLRPQADVPEARGAAPGHEPGKARGANGRGAVPGLTLGAGCGFAQPTRVSSGISVHGQTFLYASPGGTYRVHSLRVRDRPTKSHR